MSNPTPIARFIKGAKVKKSTTTSPNHYIGYVTLENINGTGGSLPGIEFMYFKGYTIDENSILEYNKFEEDFPNHLTEYFQFNVCFLRIPTDLQFVPVKDDGSYQPVDAMSIKMTKNILGLTIVNVHGSSILPTSISNRTYSPPSHHLKTPDDDPLFDNGKFGCLSVVGFDGIRGNKVPIFKGKTLLDYQNSGSGEVECYFILNLNTDLTPTFCTARTTSPQNQTNDVISHLIDCNNSNKKPLGIKVDRPIHYAVNDYSNSLGIYIVSKFSTAWRVHPGKKFQNYITGGEDDLS